MSNTFSNTNSQTCQTIGGTYNSLQYLYTLYISMGRRGENITWLLSFKRVLIFHILHCFLQWVFLFQFWNSFKFSWQFKINKQSSRQIIIRLAREFLSSLIEFFSYNNKRLYLREDPKENLAIVFQARYLKQVDLKNYTLRIGFPTKLQPNLLRR